jgi:hypothetical protein
MSSTAGGLTATIGLGTMIPAPQVHLPALPAYWSLTAKAF